MIKILKSKNPSELLNYGLLLLISSSDEAKDFEFELEDDEDCVCSAAEVTDVKFFCAPPLAYLPRSELRAGSPPSASPLALSSSKKL